MLPLERLEAAQARYGELLTLMGDPSVLADSGRLREVGQEQSELEPLVSTYREYRAALAEADELRQLAKDQTDSEIAELAAQELAALLESLSALEERLRALLVPEDPLDKKDVIVEIRAGTGGDEAGLFSADLFRMYSRYAEGRGWKVDVISSSESGLGGLREVIFEVKGRGAYSRLKWESGVHRVQRVPATEAAGRIHTSTATVAVLPEVDDIEIHIPENDLRIDIFRSTGPGGQSVNTTDSAVRMTHLPTGLVVTCQDEKSQLQNRRKALQVLRARLYQLEEDRRQAERSAARRDQIGSGERSEKIRTYNFPQSRLTDHRIGLTLHKLEQVLAGELDEIIDALQVADRGQRMEAAGTAVA